MLINTFPYFYSCVDASWAGKRVCFGSSQYFSARACFHVSNKRTVLTSWNAYAFLLVVVCHGGDLLKATKPESSVHIMRTCLSQLLRINQWTSLLYELWCHTAGVDIQQRKWENMKNDSSLGRWGVKSASNHVRNSTHMIVFWSHLDTLLVENACVAFSMQGSLMSLTNFPYSKANYVELTC